jgi:hypothetical protein
MNYKIVEHKLDLLKVIENLMVENKDSWENITINDYLEALGTWLEDADGFYKNQSLKTDSENPSWQLFADALQAAKSYE